MIRNYLRYGKYKRSLGLYRKHISYKQLSNINNHVYSQIMHGILAGLLRANKPNDKIDLHTEFNSAVHRLIKVYLDESRMLKFSSLSYEDNFKKKRALKTKLIILRHIQKNYFCN